jgi:putative tricarboxylic transport membrane protein
MDILNGFTSTLGSLAGGFGTALQPFNLLLLTIGCFLGLVIGVLPGLGGTSGVAILLPITVFIANTGPSGATSAVISHCGIYWGALFGGVITSILFIIPGERWSVVLVFDGFPLAK